MIKIEIEKLINDIEQMKETAKLAGYDWAILVPTTKLINIQYILKYFLNRCNNE